MSEPIHVIGGGFAGSEAAWTTIQRIQADFDDSELRSPRAGRVQQPRRRAR